MGAAPPSPHRIAAMGETGEAGALFFDQYLWRTGPDEYAVFTNETRDAGRTYIGPRLARFHLSGALVKRYAPRRPDDPDYFCEPDVPGFYHPVTEKHGAAVGAYLFGRVIRLPDGALAVSGYATMEGNVPRKRKAAVRPDAGNAPEATEETLFSSLLFRSEDEGATWTHVSTIGKAAPGQPFDTGQRHSEGFTETGLSCTADGKVYALLRHGKYLLLWRNVSSDSGRTWGGTMCFNYPGVAPSVCLMPGGALATAWGRPGLTVGFGLDGTGRTWDVLAGVMQDDSSSKKYP